MDHVEIEPAALARLTEPQLKAINALVGPNISWMVVEVDPDSAEDEVVVYRGTRLGTTMVTVLNYNGKAKEAVR